LFSSITFSAIGGVVTNKRHIASPLSPLLVLSPTTRYIAYPQVVGNNSNNGFRALAFIAKPLPATTLSLRAPPKGGNWIMALPPLLAPPKPSPGGRA